MTSEIHERCARLCTFSGEALLRYCFHAIQPLRLLINIRSFLNEEILSNSRESLLKRESEKQGS